MCQPRANFKGSRTTLCNEGYERRNPRQYSFARGRKKDSSPRGLRQPKAARRRSLFFKVALIFVPVKSGPEPETLPKLPCFGLAYRVRAALPRFPVPQSRQTAESVVASKPFTRHQGGLALRVLGKYVRVTHNNSIAFLSPEGCLMTGLGPGGLSLIAGTNPYLVPESFPIRED